MRIDRQYYQCTDVRQRLDDYLDQELPFTEVYFMLAHLGNCAACATTAHQRYDVLAQLRETVQRLSLPTGLAPHIFERLHACRQQQAKEPPGT